MNILWIMADQMRADFTGYQSNGKVKTPAIDALAAAGTVFTKAFAQAPICTPSRTCSFTSRYVHAHGAWWNGFGPSRPRPTLPALLREAGYRTALVGKLHIYPQADSNGFEFKEMHEECLASDLSAYDAFLCENGLEPAAVHTEWLNAPAEAGICRLPDELEETRWVADRACAYLRATRSEPFFLYASFVRPHSPYNPLPRFLDVYEREEFPAPPFNPKEWDQVPPRVRAMAETWGWQRLNSEDFQHSRRHYAALCSQVDDGVGRILSTLEDAGLSGETIVVFTSDHGDYMGEHGLLYKEHLWDGSLHVPLVVRDPRSTANRYDGLVESIDVMPTLLDAVGVPIPESVQGRSLVPVMRDTTLRHRDAAFAEFAEYSVTPGVHHVVQQCVNPHMASVRTDRWKYIHYIGEDGELYDLEADPGERCNLFGHPQYWNVVSEMRQRLLDWHIATADLEPPSADNPYFATYFGGTPPGMPPKGSWG